MAVIIPNMDIPKSCDMCPFMIPSKSPEYPFVDCRFKGRLGSVFNFDNSIPVDCPLKSADDVVPMETIDKMIADIEKLRGCSCYVSDGIIDDVVDIIEEYCKENT